MLWQTYSKCYFTPWKYSNGNCKIDEDSRFLGLGISGYQSTAVAAQWYGESQLAVLSFSVRNSCIIMTLGGS